MPGGNDVIPNNHFKKKWRGLVKTWFNQPARKVRRRNGEWYRGINTCATGPAA